MSAASFRLDGRVALVTGASRGLGRRFALTLARAGAKVALAARSPGQLSEVAQEIENSGGRALPLSLDITDPDSISRAVDCAQTELGALRILVNNAGVAISSPALEVGEKDWDLVLDTNLKGAWLMARQAALAMKTHGEGGSIVNVASILGLLGTQQVASYCASKAGLINLTRALAAEWARYGIRVNALAPGYVKTDLNREFLESAAGEKIRRSIPQQRFGQFGDLEGPLLLLASDAGAYMTGSTIVVDGGQSSCF